MARTFLNSVRQCKTDRRAVTSIEYALVGVLIAAVIAGSVAAIGGPLSGMFSAAATGINNHPAATSGSSSGTGSSIGGN